MLRLVLLVSMLAACDGPPSPSAGSDPRPSPAAPSGNPLVGTKLDLAPLRWVTADGKPADLTANRLTLLRWWTVECPFCKDSLPALCELQRRFGPRGLGLVAVFHNKGPVEPTDAELQQYLTGLGCSPVLARDDRWTVLRPLLERGKLEQATSISLLIDKDGVVQWVQGGPRLHPSKDPEEARADADFKQLERLLEQRLPR
jgi:hypothetical protein